MQVPVSSSFPLSSSQCKSPYKAQQILGMDHELFGRAGPIIGKTCVHLDHLGDHLDVVGYLYCCCRLLFCSCGYLNPSFAPIFRFITLPPILINNDVNSSLKHLSAGLRQTLQGRQNKFQATEHLGLLLTNIRIKKINGCEWNK